MKLKPNFLALLGLLAMPLCALAITATTPLSADTVLEVLPTVTRQRPTLASLVPARATTAAVATALQPAVSANPATASIAAQAARQDIALARQTGETRFWGRAQATLGPWWDKADAPPDLAILQATVQQGRHEFDASRKVLAGALGRAPQNAQGWLNLASLERLSANYAAALAACTAVQRAGQPLYAQACQLETQSLQGQHGQASQGLTRLLGQVTDAGQRSWLLSLLAESLERSGRDADAKAAYEQSLRAEPDLYTAIALSDLLLRTQRFKPALAVLAGLPETDAVLLRRATAWRRLGDDRWQATRTELARRHAELLRRGDDPTLHGREMALVALWLDDDAAQAVSLSSRNLNLQREPLDWWIALQSARAAKDAQAMKAVTQGIKTAGLQDVRLSLP